MPNNFDTVNRNNKKNTRRFSIWILLPMGLKSMPKAHKATDSIGYALSDDNMSKRAS